MSIDDYLSLTGMTLTALAERVGCSLGTLSDIRSGKRDPSADMVRRIGEATDGKVEPNDLIRQRAA